jgi:hypothetical protein
MLVSNETIERNRRVVDAGLDARRTIFAGVDCRAVRAPPRRVHSPRTRFPRSRTSSPISSGGTAHGRDEGSGTSSADSPDYLCGIEQKAAKIAKNMELNLDLSSTQVSDAGLKDLAALKNLQILDLSFMKATEAGVISFPPSDRR